MKEQGTKQKQNLQRNIAMTFRVSEKERELIRQAQKESGVRNMRAYLLKMAVNGRIINIELDSVQDMNRLMSGFSNNVNQIARRVNQTGNIYKTDIEEISSYLDDIWKNQSEILRRLSGLYDVFNAKCPERKVKNLINIIRPHSSSPEVGAADGEAGLTENARSAHFSNRGFGGSSATNKESCDSHF
jgi:hypothetical protein